MKRLYSLMPLLLLSIATAFSVSCEKPEPEPPAPPVEKPEITTAERLVGKWVLDGFYAKSRDTLLFLENGICLRIIKESPSDTISYYYECSDQFLILYDNFSQNSPQPHHVEFYNDYNYFIMVNYPFLVEDVILNAGFRKVK